MDADPGTLSGPTSTWTPAQTQQKSCPQADGDGHARPPSGQPLGSVLSSSLWKMSSFRGGRGDNSSPVCLSWAQSGVAPVPSC